MTRLPSISTRALRLAVAASMIGFAVPAFAQAATPQPVIDGAPGAIGYRSGATIKGHLENGAPSDEVTLQFKRPGREWNDLKTKPVTGEQSVSFRAAELKTTKVFRLRWVDELTGVSKYSETRRVEVRPRLTVRLEPKHAFQGASVKLKGSLRPEISGRKVAIKRKANGRWSTLKKVAAGDGTFALRVSSDSIGKRSFKAVFAGDKLNPGRSRKGVLKVYDPDPATWYGPGFYGNGTACGKTLRRGTLGVAHRTLPCGTMVSIVFHGRSITVPVIDRGPYTSAEWDLTQETAERIGFSGTQTVGTLHK